jgi:hypothetical protein
MNGYDLGVLLTAIRGALPNKRAEEFDEILYRGCMSSGASEALRFALGIDRANAQLRKFEVITGGTA